MKPLMTFLQYRDEHAQAVGSRLNRSRVGVILQDMGWGNGSRTIRGPLHVCEVDPISTGMRCRGGSRQAVSAEQCGWRSSSLKIAFSPEQLAPADRCPSTTRPRQGEETAMENQDIFAIAERESHRPRAGAWSPEEGGSSVSEC